MGRMTQQLLIIQAAEFGRPNMRQEVLTAGGLSSAVPTNAAAVRRPGRHKLAMLGAKQSPTEKKYIHT